MRLATSRFGTIDYQENEVVTLREGMPGLENHTRYLILRPPESQPFFWLQSLHDSHTALPVIQPQIFLPDYQIELSDQLVAELQVQKGHKLVPCCVISLGKELEDAFVNLLTPIVVNTGNNLARQIMMEKKPYTSKHNLFELLSSQKAKAKSGRSK